MVISNIKFVDKYSDISSYNDLLNQYMKNTGRENGICFFSYYIDILYYVKYIIEKNNLDYSKVINGDLTDILPILEEKFKNVMAISTKIQNFVDYNFCEMLKYIAFKDYEIPALNDRVIDSYIDESKRYIFISSGHIPYIKSNTVDVWIEKQVSSITGHYSTSLIKYLVYDEILGFDRKLYDSGNRGKICYEYGIYYNYGKFKEVYDVLPSWLHCSQMFMVYQYNDISNYNTLRMHSFLRNTKNVLFDKDNAYIVREIGFNYDLNKTINIKELTNIKDEDLSKILLSNDEIDKVSINVSPSDIVNNNFRLGLSAYINKRGDNEIIELIDANSRISKKIERLNKEISNKIDEMLVR